ncbi:MAG: trypsin-like peptidase domain-containing protein [Planctomycetota bacterium]
MTKRTTLRTLWLVFIGSTVSFCVANVNAQTVNSPPPVASPPAISSKPSYTGSVTALQRVSSSTPSNLATAVAVPKTLETIFERGGVPESFEQLQQLQRQHQRIASKAAECTVSVQIGPAQGGGVIITDSGYVLTAAHVAMRPRKNALLTLSNGRTVTATTLGMNRGVDAGLMKIDAGQNNGRPWPHASLGSSKNLQPGMWCIATGHPGGYDSSRGMVTRVGRILAVRPGSLVTDCALIGGDSGGPLFDLSGRLIAVHSRIGNDVADNLHVPVSHYDEHWARMERGEAWGYLPGFRPMLGVRGNRQAPQAEILSVTPGSPADDAGLQEGDIIEVFGDSQVTNFASLKEAVSDTMPGERIKIYLRRRGVPMSVTLEIGRADDD